MTLRSAATVILLRPDGRVALLQRAPGLRFLGGFWVFPGGACDEGESTVAAAVRETFEETGLELDPRELSPCGRYVTPDSAPVHYDVQFFLANVAPAAELSITPGEVVAGEWLTPDEVLERWATDRARLTPHTRLMLEALRDTGGDASAMTAACPASGEHPGAIDFWPGIRLFRVRTPTLPPATHTNCLIVGDGSELVVIDPASPYPDEQERLDALLDDLAAGGQRVREILLTHHHTDHVSGAQHLADRLGVPIAAHATTRELLADQGVRVTRDVADGERIELPADRPGARPRALVAHLLEGHADGHLVFQEQTTRAVIAGDMVAGTGTIVVNPPEGKMGLYLTSLRRLQDLDASLLYPSHGPAIGDPRAYAQHYIEHRLGREAKIADALAQLGSATVEELVPLAYDDKPPEIFPLAARAALAHLLKLEEDGRALRTAERWSAGSPSSP